jgi:hypothetical protein
MRPAAYVLFAITLLSFCAIAQPSIKVSLEPRTLTASEGEKVEIKLVIVSSSQLAYAGEFNVSYPSSMAKVSVESGKNWTIEWVPSVQRYVFHRKPQTSVSDPSTLAVLTVEVQPGATSFTINLTLFNAANASGKDLSITFENRVVSVTVARRGGGGGGGGEEQVSGVGGGRVGGIDWRAISIAATAAVAAAAIAAVYYVYAQPAVYLLIDGRALRLRGSRIVIGREDLAGILPPEKLAYVTRRAKGGQFQIIRYGNAFYIQDSGSANGTYVNGVDIRGRGWVQLRNGDVISVPNAFQAVFRTG